MFAYCFALMERAKVELNRLQGDRQGITAVEYGLIAAVMVAALAATFQKLTGALDGLMDTIVGKVNP